MNIFEYNQYKTYLKEYTALKQKGFITTLAKAAGCQRSYLSQVFNTHVHLTKDQAFKIGNYLNLAKSESKYFLLLVEYDRCSSLEYRQYLAAQIQKIKQEQKLLTKRVSKEKVNTLDGNRARIYYSSWYYAALHIATSMPSLKTADDFSTYLQLPVKIVSQTLKEIAEWGLVKWNGSEWVYDSAVQFHLGSHSLLSKMNHINLQTKVMNSPLDEGKNLNYSSIFTIKASDYQKIRDQLIELIECQREVIANSNCDELVIFRCDLENFSN